MGGHGTATVPESIAYVCSRQYSVDIVCNQKLFIHCVTINVELLMNVYANKKKSPSPAYQVGMKKIKKTFVFISHDSRDAELAEEFSKLLHNASAGVLKTFRSSDRKGSDGIDFGLEWYQIIMSKIDEASDIICLLTPKSIDRPWILYEAGVAKGKTDGKVIGVALGVQSKAAFNGPFAQFQNNDGSIESLTKLVLDLVKKNSRLNPDSTLVNKLAREFHKKAKQILLKTQRTETDMWGFSKTGKKTEPTSYSPDVLEGLWLSKFTYIINKNKEKIRGVQYDIESLTVNNKTSLIGSNILATSKMKKAFFHDLRLEITNNYLIGSWTNVNTKNVGVLQLYIHTHNHLMTGRHMGNENDNSVNCGTWEWVKIQTPKKLDQKLIDSLKNKSMISFEDLNNHFDKWLDKDYPVKLSSLIGK